MCGDLDDDGRLDDELYAWLVATARRQGAARGESAEPHQRGEPGTPGQMAALFRDALARAVAGIGGAEPGHRAEAIRDEAIVLARLAGLLAGHLPPETDAFRTLVDALMDGSREAERTDHTRHHHGHDHEH
jgi:hypothetical protein